MTAYKGLDRHELSKETQEVEGLQRDLAGEANAATLAKLGFDKIAAELFATNAVLAEAVARREAKRGDREASAGGETTANVRKEACEATSLYWLITPISAVTAPSSSADGMSLCAALTRATISTMRLDASAKREKPEPGPETRLVSGNGPNRLRKQPLRLTRGLFCVKKRPFNLRESFSTFKSVAAI